MHNLKASYMPYRLVFNRPILTSRVEMVEKTTWVLKITFDSAKTEKTIYGECNYFSGLSIDNWSTYQTTLKLITQTLTTRLNSLDSNHSSEKLTHQLTNLENELLPTLKHHPSIACGVESLLASYRYHLTNDAPLNDNTDYTPVIYPSDFTTPSGKKIGIPINGLIWMGTVDFMAEQLIAIQANNYPLIKIKVGALDFKRELDLIKKVREDYPKIPLRLDANGGFENDSLNEVLNKIEQLAKYSIHSLEQPIIKDLKKLKTIIQKSPIKIALDETLINQAIIGDHNFTGLDNLSPDYLVLKPSLLGGFKNCQAIIDWAISRKVGWWVTSALESSIGLNAIAQWTYTLNEWVGNERIQGLGTGAIYKNNFASKLRVNQGQLYYRRQ